MFILSRAMKKYTYRASKRKDMWEFEGDLYSDKLGCKTPLRKGYSGHSREIKSGAQLRACIRAGRCTFPGLYDIAYYTNDGVELCSDCVLRNLPSITNSIRTKCDDGWRVTGLFHEGESEEECVCSNCSLGIFS